MPGVPPGGGVTFCLRQKVTKKRLECGGTRQNSLRAPEGSPFGQPPRVSGFIRGVIRHFALLVPVDLATSRDVVREFLC